jgi:LacI family transcriptional regulator
MPKKHPSADITGKIRSEIRSNIPRVALLVETSREVGRNILRGIDRYIRQHGPWAIHMWPGDTLQKLPDMKAWGGTGIIARIVHPEVEKAILKSGLPTVAIDLFDEKKIGGAAFHHCSEVYTDSVHAGIMGAEHLMQQGFKQFAFVGEVNDVTWSRQRRDGFIQRLKEAGLTCYCYPTPPPSCRNWGKELYRLGTWLLSLPKPIGLMAAMDVRGRQVIEACHHNSIDVPREVAILGVDNDPLICNLCDPPMSSIALDAETGGYRAAEFLDVLMQKMKKKQRAPKNPFSLPPMRYAFQPTGVVLRRSTEFFIVEDELVIDALKFIRINATLPLTVAQVVHHLNVSRRTLEMRFQKHLHRSVLSEIIQQRLGRIKLMLNDNALTVHNIALACGFESEAYLCRFFRRETGQTMSEYRKKERRNLR